MKEWREKKLKAAQRFRIGLLVLLAVMIGSFVLVGVLEEAEVMIAPIVLSANALWICGLIYLTVYFPFTRSVKRLVKRGLENVADDIALDNPTLPRSNIYCGQNAFFSKKPCAIIPYADVAWVYLHERRMYGFIVVEKSVILHTKDDKKFTLNAHEDEFKWLLTNFIGPKSPRVIVGYGREQIRRYRHMDF